MSTSGRSQAGGPKPKPAMTKTDHSPKARSCKQGARSAPPKPSKEDASIKKFKKQLESEFGSLVHPIGTGDSGAVFCVQSPKHGDGEFALKVPNSAAKSALKSEFDNAKLLPPHENLIQYVAVIQEADIVPPVFADPFSSSGFGFPPQAAHYTCSSSGTSPVYSAPLTGGFSSTLPHGSADAMDVDQAAASTYMSPCASPHRSSFVGGNSPNSLFNPMQSSGLVGNSSQLSGNFAHSNGSMAQSHNAMGYAATVNNGSVSPARAGAATTASKGSVAVLLEYAKGGSLWDRLDRNRPNPIPEDLLRYWARDVLEGLRFMHAHGYMHLDIKPANIFLGSPSNDSNGKSQEIETAMIGDFGRMVAYRTFLSTGAEEGDSTYLAPFVDDAEQPIHAPDIFSLGVTLLECATQYEMPKSGRDDYQALREDAIPEQYLSGLSPELASMITKMLRKNPYERPTAEQLLAAPFLESLPPPTPKRRKSRSTSFPDTPIMLSSYHAAIASSAPSSNFHQFMFSGSPNQRRSIGTPLARVLDFGRKD